MSALFYHAFPAPSDAPFETVHLYACEDYLRAIFFKPWEKAHQEGCIKRKNNLMKLAERELLEYFSGERQTFSVAHKSSGTPFQTAAWKHLCTIQYGSTQSYGEMAKAMNNPNASRAVGAANGKNPLSIIVPCHRVVGANGSLTGYAGGVNTKQWLLNLEQRHSSKTINN